MLKKIFSLALLITGVVCLQAQDIDENPIIPTIDKRAPKVDKLDYSLSAGTSFITSKTYGSGSSTYIAPELTYKLTPKLHLNVGIMFMRSNYLVNRYQRFAGEQSAVIKTNPNVSTLAYISGDYLINNRLSISGMLMRDLSSPQGFGSNSFQAMSVHMDYKLTDNISIGAGVQMRQGNNWSSPYGNGFYPSTQYPFLNY